LKPDTTSNDVRLDRPVRVDAALRLTGRPRRIGKHRQVICPHFNRAGLVSSVQCFVPGDHRRVVDDTPGSSYDLWQFVFGRAG
jgi:hypothetical protein